MALDPPPALPRRPTGVAGFDRILYGGLPTGKLYLVVGAPGTGKTILTNQLAFHHAASGGHALYLTFLSESHTQMLSALATLAFYDQTVVGQAIHYLAGFPLLDQEGLDGLSSHILTMIRDHQATVLVIDGLSTIASHTASPLAMKRFFAHLQAAAEAYACTMLLISHDSDFLNSPAHIMVDGLIELTNRKIGLRMVRELEIWKLRGSPYVEGKHHFSLSTAGLSLYPRTEAILGYATERPTRPRVLRSTGVPRLDTMLGGGLRSGSTTILLGPHGSGKTVLSLALLAANARAGAPSLYFSFNEHPETLLEKAAGIGLDLAPLRAANQILLQWSPMAENIADRLVEELLALIDHHHIECLVLDSIHGLVTTLVYPERHMLFMGALIRELSRRSVTTILTVELKEVVGPGLVIPVVGGSEYADTILCLRYVEIDSQLRRLISIMKLDHGDYDTAIRSFQITRQGVSVDEPFSHAQAVLTGVAVRTLGRGGVL